MSKCILTQVYLCIYVSTIIQAARILAVFPMPSISHQVVFRSLTHELAKRGHEVVVITPDPAFPKGEAPANLTEIDVRDISYKIWRDFVLQPLSEQKDDAYTKLRSLLDGSIEVVKEQIQNQEVKELMKHKKTHFDLLLLESCLKQTLIYSYLFKAPIILISSFGAVPGNEELFGAPTYPPLVYPGLFRQRIYNLTAWEKLTELYNTFHVNRLFMRHEEKSNEMLRNIFGSDTPTLSDLDNNVDMIFLNMHPVWQGNYPVPPSVVFMGGVHQTPLKELPKDLKSYLDSSVNGVIYVSFGTNVSPSFFPPENIQIMIKVFSQLPYDILLKWDKDDLPGKSKNIKIFKWLPQSDTLRHPKIKLFITQAGLQSTDEAITAGVPLIGIPLLADQWFNAEKYVYHKIGLTYNIKTFAEETFLKAINTVITDNSYRNNVAKLRTLMLDQPQSSLERAVWWTEHVVRHGGARHLRAPAANMSWSEYLELELIFIVLACLTGVLVVFSMTAYVLVCMVKKQIRGDFKFKRS